MIDSAYANSYAYKLGFLQGYVKEAIRQIENGNATYAQSLLAYAMDEIGDE